MQFKDPTTALIISIFGGAYGIDRFYIGDTGLGIVKLLTCGGLMVWTIVDWFLIQGLTREKNMEAFHNYLY
jgi:TM2 domain-containing membrane protein YozV